MEGRENNSITIQKGIGSSLKVVRDIQPRYYFYFRQGVSRKQSVQPVSRHIAEKILTEYSQGKSSWKTALRLKKIEPDEVEDYDIEAEDIKSLSHSELHERMGRIKIFTWLVVVLFIFIAGISWFFALNIETVDFETGANLAVMVFIFLAASIALLYRRVALNRELSLREKGRKDH